MEDKPCRKKRSAPELEKTQFEDEALETIWELAERGEVLFDALVEELQDARALRQMQADGLIELQGEKVLLTKQGRARARDITRRHLLAERLFADVLDLKEYEEDACRFEHAISPEVERAICTFLGHPPTCPHGRPIPRGECCKLFAKTVRPLVHPLPDAQVGEPLRVVFLATPMMDRLASLGLVPGAVVSLRQKRPTVVLSIDETTLALEEEVARGIFVKPHESEV